jgi:hypothetical protein
MEIIGTYADSGTSGLTLMQFQLRVNQDNAGAVGDASDLPQARPCRKEDWRCIDLQFSAAPVPKDLAHRSHQERALEEGGQEW